MHAHAHVGVVSCDKDVLFVVCRTCHGLLACRHLCLSVAVVHVHFIFDRQHTCRHCEGRHAGVCVDQDVAMKKVHRCLNAMTALRHVRVTAPNTPTGDGLVAAALQINRLTCLKLMSANMDVRKLPDMHASLFKNAHAIYALQLGLSNHTFIQPPTAGPAGYDNSLLGTARDPALLGRPKPLEDERWNSREACVVIRNLPALRELVLLQWPPWQWRDALAVTNAATSLTKLELYIAFPDLPQLIQLRNLQHLRLTVGGGGGKGWLVQAATRGGNRGRGRGPSQLPPAELGESPTCAAGRERFGSISQWPFKEHLRTLHLQLANGFMTKAAALASAAPDSPTSPAKRAQKLASKVVQAEDGDGGVTSQIVVDDGPTLGYQIASELSTLVRLTELHLTGLPKYTPTTRTPSDDFSAALCRSLAGMPQLQHLEVGPQCLPQGLNAALHWGQNLTYLDLALRPSVDPSLPVLARLDNLVVRGTTSCGHRKLYMLCTRSLDQFLLICGRSMVQHQGCLLRGDMRQWHVQVLRLTHNLPSLSASVVHLRNLRHLRTLRLGVPALDYVTYESMFWNHQWPPSTPGNAASFSQGFSHLTTLNVRPALYQMRGQARQRIQGCVASVLLPAAGAVPGVPMAIRIRPRPTAVSALAAAAAAPAALPQ